MKTNPPLKLFLAAFFGLVILFQSIFVILAPGVSYAAPSDESKTSTCKDKGKKDECNEGFNEGFKKQRNGEDRLIDACGKEPDAVRGANDEYKDRYAGCKAGFEFAKDKPGAAAPANKLNPEDTGKDEEEKEVECEDGGELAWIICPVINLGIKFTDTIYKDFVEPLLEDVPISINPKDGSYIAWQQFRLIGNILLVASLLAVVYSQAKGGK